MTARSPEGAHHGRDHEQRMLKQVGIARPLGDVFRVVGVHENTRAGLQFVPDAAQRLRVRTSRFPRLQSSGIESLPRLRTRSIPWSRSQRWRWRRAAPPACASAGRSRGRGLKPPNDRKREPAACRARPAAAGPGLTPQRPAPTSTSTRTSICERAAPFRGERQLLKNDQIVDANADARVARRGREPFQLPPDPRPHC